MYFTKYVIPTNSGTLKPPIGAIISIISLLKSLVSPKNAVKSKKLNFAKKAATNKKIRHTSIVIRHALNGYDIFIMYIKPINPVRIVQIVDKCLLSMLPGNICAESVAATTQITTVSADGKAFEITFLKNLPVTSSLFGSSASTTDGIPMVTIPIKVICRGSNGKSDLIIIKINAKSKL